MDSPTGDADPHDQDLIPKVVGKLYKVGSRLGAGSFGVLYEGMHRCCVQTLLLRENC